VADVSDFVEALCGRLRGTALDPEVVTQLLGRPDDSAPSQGSAPGSAKCSRSWPRGPTRRSQPALVNSEGAVEKHVANIFAKASTCRCRSRTTDACSQPAIPRLLRCCLFDSLTGHSPWSEVLSSSYSQLLALANPRRSRGAVPVGGLVQVSPSGCNMASRRPRWATATRTRLPFWMALPDVGAQACLWCGSTTRGRSMKILRDISDGDRHGAGSLAIAAPQPALHRTRRA